MSKNNSNFIVQNKRNKIVVINVTRTVMELDPSTGEYTLKGSNVSYSKITDESGNMINRPIWQAMPSEAKYGIINLSKNNKLGTLYEAGENINIRMNGIDTIGRFDPTQKRINGLTSLFSNFKELEPRVFAYDYEATTNTIIFTEI